MNTNTDLGLRFLNWVGQYRYKFAGEYSSTGEGPYFQSGEWCTRDEAMTAIPKFQQSLAAGKYKSIELLTSVKRNGRWRFESRTAVFGSQLEAQS